MKEDPVSSVSHRTPVLTLRAWCHFDQQTKVKGFFARLRMSQLSQASPRCSTAKASTAEDTRQYRHMNEYQRMKNTALLFHYY